MGKLSLKALQGLAKAMCKWVGVMDWMFVSSPNSYVEALTLNVMVYGGGASGRWLGLDEVKGWGPHDGICVLIIIRDWTLSLPCEHKARQLSASQDEGLHQNLTILVLWDFQTPELWEIDFCFVRHPVYGTLSLQPEQTKTMRYPARSPTGALSLNPCITRANHLPTLRLTFPVCKMGKCPSYRVVVRINEIVTTMVIGELRLRAHINETFFVVVLKHM